MKAKKVVVANRQNIDEKRMEYIIMGYRLVLAAIWESRDRETLYALTFERK